MSTFGLGYRVTSTPNRDFSITATYVASTSPSKGWIRLPQTWRFSYPVSDGVVSKLGASKTLGILGGMENRRQYLCSEMLERAIGDVLTAAICEILESGVTVNRTTIVVFGLAFPKLVGRVLSLRMPRHVGVVWMCPTPFPPWIAEGVNESAFLATLGSGFGTEWDDEAMIRASSLTLAGQEMPLYIQQLAPWSVIPPFDPDEYTWLASGLCEALLPREVVVAAGHVQNHLVEPYNGEPEEELRPLIQPTFPAKPYLAVPRQRRGGLPVWDIAWAETDSLL